MLILERAHTKKKRLSSIHIHRASCVVQFELPLVCIAHTSSSSSHVKMHSAHCHARHPTNQPEKEEQTAKRTTLPNNNNNKWIWIVRLRRRIDSSKSIPYLFLPSRSSSIPPPPPLSSSSSSLIRYWIEFVFFINYFQCPSLLLCAYPRDCSVVCSKCPIFSFFFLSFHFSFLVFELKKMCILWK